MMSLPQAPAKMLLDMAVVTSALDIDVAAALVTDTSGKKSSIHKLAHELLKVVTDVLTMKHFNVFTAAEALNKSYVKTCQEDMLCDLVFENLLNPWKDASVAYLGEQKRASEKDDEKKGPASGSQKEGEEDDDRLQTRTEAIDAESMNEVRTYNPSYVMTGNATTDHAVLMSKYNSMTKTLDTDTSSWNQEAKGNRRAVWYDEAGRKDVR